MLTILTLLSKELLKSSKLIVPCSVDFKYLISAPVFLQIICQGIILEWCSISVSKITSPDFKLSYPHDSATRLILSVALLVKTIEFFDAPIKSAILFRLFSKALVAISPNS